MQHEEDRKGVGRGFRMPTRRQVTTQDSLTHSVGVHSSHRCRIRFSQALTLLGLCECAKGKSVVFQKRELEYSQCSFQVKTTIGTVQVCGLQVGQGAALGLLEPKQRLQGVTAALRNT